MKNRDKWLISGTRDKTSKTGTVPAKTAQMEGLVIVFFLVYLVYLQTFARIVLQKFISEMDGIPDRILCVASSGLRPKRLSAAQFDVSVPQLSCGFMEECIWRSILSQFWSVRGEHSYLTSLLYHVLRAIYLPWK